MTKNAACPLVSSAACCRGPGTSPSSAGAGRGLVSVDPPLAGRRAGSPAARSLSSRKAWSATWPSCTRWSCAAFDLCALRTAGQSAYRGLETVTDILKDERFHAAYCHKAVRKYSPDSGAEFRRIQKTERQYYGKAMNHVLNHFDTLMGGAVKPHWVVLRVLARLGLAFPPLPLYDKLPTQSSKGDYRHGRRQGSDSSGRDCSERKRLPAGHHAPARRLGMGSVRCTCTSAPRKRSSNICTCE